jgi:D-proline reductase (dithiol) PrdB
MMVDSFKFLPRIIATFYQMTEREPQHPIPWTPLTKPIGAAKFGLVTSGGLYLKEVQEPFNLEREKAEPSWGDPSYRIIPSTVMKEDIAMSHLHLNTRDIKADFNILLPIHRMQEFVKDGLIGALADDHYAFMGYQGFPPDSRAWETEYGPQIAHALHNEGVHCVLLTPA